ncbi:class I SAM-dependent methyltransferase [Streptomyces mobaraensis]|uniref:Class I SAM-dependent methyltransferase n=1 Tax=Streptomyces mobaraensis TaxID=35621 RepID=A0A5N5W2P6_STRMB|nr:class I SAM-dependent methyltransferase [Streptomyces mobaraensis]KAB7836951.1 class I SAM-dependent methyltransferase [Streptomyces mobaraensis]
MGTSEDDRVSGGDRVSGEAGGRPEGRGAPAPPPVGPPVHPPPVDPPVDLPPVALTSLWTLHHRASAARRKPPLLDDPVAVELVDRCAWPLETWFGRPRSLPEQYLARRARLYDAATAEFLRAHPEETVIALGEGLETQFWRVDNGTVRWLSVDLPDMLALRRAVLPHGGRQRAVGCSATDPRWAERTGTDIDTPVLISAQGLFMYLTPAEAAALVRLCAGRFRRGVLLFDTLPGWVVRCPVRRFLTWGGTFRFPPLHATRRSACPGRVAERPIGPYTLGTGAAVRPLHLAQRWRWVRTVFMPAFVRLDVSDGR